VSVRAIVDLRVVNVQQHDVNCFMRMPAAHAPRAVNNAVTDTISTTVSTMMNYGLIDDLIHRLS
jgi:hypothetical protein